MKTNMKKLRGVGYRRVSTTEQVEGTSLESQREAIEAYCKMKGIDLIASFSDEGVSGGKPISERPEGSKLTALVDSGEVDVVVIVKLDRAFRNVQDCLSTIDTWDSNDIGLHVLDMQGMSVDSRSTMGRFMLVILAAVGEMERGMIRDRCQNGREASRKLGKRLGTVPYGFDVEEETNVLVENPEEQAVIQTMSRMLQSGFSLNQVAKELNTSGVPTKKGGSWTAKSVSRILDKAA